MNNGSDNQSLSYAINIFFRGSVPSAKWYVKAKMYCLGLFNALRKDMWFMVYSFYL